MNKVSMIWQQSLCIKGKTPSNRSKEMKKRKIVNIYLYGFQIDQETLMQYVFYSSAKLCPRVRYYNIVMVMYIYMWVNQICNNKNYRFAYWLSEMYITELYRSVTVTVNLISFCKCLNIYIYISLNVHFI